MAKTTTQLVATHPKLRVGENVYVRVVREPHQRAEVAILINEETTAENLRDAWQVIVRVRDQVFEQQGTNFGNAVNALRLEHYRMHCDGYSYAEIAMEINYDCLVHLCGAKLAYEQQNLESYRKRLYYFQVNLEAVRTKVQDILAYTTDGFVQVSAGESPWSLKTGPVDRARVYAAIKQLKSELKSGKVIFG